MVKVRAFTDVFWPPFDAGLWKQSRFLAIAAQCHHLGSDFDGSAHLAPVCAPYGHKAIFGLVKKSKTFADARRRLCPGGGRKTMVELFTSKSC